MVVGFRAVPLTLLLFVSTLACSSSNSDSGAAVGGTPVTTGNESSSTGGPATSGVGTTGLTQGATGSVGSSTVGGGAVGTTGATASAGSATTGVGGVANTATTAAVTTGAGGSTTGSASTTNSGGGGTDTGGTTGGDTVCGTADEGSSTTLSCPDGEIIDSVVFASYGNPEGTCGAFTLGDCQSGSSKSMVQSLCVGRRACTVPAANATFGDPCNSTVKNLAVEVQCVVGEPTVPTDTPYKGVANSPANELSALGASWCYNWGTTPQASDCGDPLFVPMVWGDSDVAGAIQAIGNAGYDTVLGFNEPNKSDQANMTVARAIELWPTLTSNPDIRVGSPAVSDDGRAWLEDFMDQVQQNGLRVDFIAMHWYGWNAGSCTSGSLEGAVNWASQWGLPVWITEFGCMGSSNPDEQTLLDFFAAAIPMLQGKPLVERYAWYPWNTYNDLYLDSGGARQITALGELFAAAPAYRQ